MMIELEWMANHGRGMAHLVRLETEHQYLGKKYIKTQCGRNTSLAELVPTKIVEKCVACLVSANRYDAGA